MSLKRSPKGVQRAYKFYNKYLKIEKQKLKNVFPIIELLRLQER